MILKPTGGKILLEIIKTSNEPVKVDGIFVPGKTQDQSIEAKVVAMGPGARHPNGNLIPYDVAIGDTVLIGKFSGVEVKADDKKYAIVLEDEILGIVTLE